MPWLGQKIAGDAESYRYLAESIRMHPDQETLAGIMEEVGLDRVTWKNMTFGVVRYILDSSRDGSRNELKNSHTNQRKHLF